MVKRKSVVESDDEDIVIISGSQEVVAIDSDDSDAGGFVVEKKRKVGSRVGRGGRVGKGRVKRGKVDLEDVTTVDSTPNIGSSGGELSTPPSSNEDDNDVLDLPMSSKQAGLVRVGRRRSGRVVEEEEEEEEEEGVMGGKKGEVRGKGRVKVRGKEKGKGKAVAKKQRELSYDSDEEEDYIDNEEDEDDDEDDEDYEVVKKRIKQSQLNDSDDDEDIDAIVQTSNVIPTPKRKRGSKKEKLPRLPRHVVIFQKTNENLHKNHPELKTIFEDIANRDKIKPEQVAQPDGMGCNLLPFQKEGLNWLLKQEKGIYKGGILADEMGMGKTIQTVALFMSDEENSQPTLVVAPTVALIQWKNEIELHTQGKLSVLVYHGQNRSSDVEHLQSVNVILTTYAVVESVYRKQQSGFRRKNGIVKEESPLHKIHFNRIVLDEAHNIKDRQSNTARAVFNMKANYRLCLSGTPLQNRIGEIYSLLRFLKIEPFCKYYCTKCECSSNHWTFTTSSRCDVCNHVVMQHVNFFNHSLLKHIQRYGFSGDGGIAMNNMRTLLGQIMLRRTKIERADDLGLPPRVVEIRRDYFNEEEKDLYASVYSDSNRKFTTYVNSGVVLNNYANIFTLITRMRQIADHPDLVLRRHIGAGSNGDEATNLLVCNICDDEAEEAIKSKCHHTFCRLCIKEYVEGWTGVESDLECPVCHVQLTIDLTAPAIEVDESVVKKGSIVNRINMTGGWRSSTKIEALVEELYKLRSDKQTIKSIVFSQFTSMLDLVEWRLRRAGFQTVKLQGSMSPTQRDNIIRHFMDTPSVEVFLVSLKAGGVALNLCEASQVFILDPWWNPSVEWQSGDRVHRIGQHRPVKITRLVIEDSIESRIIELQEKKARMIQATIGSDDAAMNKLTPADMQFLFSN